MSHWIEDAEAALGGEPRDAVEVLPAGRPPVLDPTGLHALISPLLAAFMWAAVVFREVTDHAPLDALTLLLRLLALALSVRALLMLKLLAERARAFVQTPAHALALTPGGLLYRSPRGDVALPIDDVIGIRAHGEWQTRGGRRWNDVYVVTRPSSGRLHLALPPFFLATPGMLAEKLMRWRGVVPEPQDVQYAEADDLPSKLFDAVAAGEQPAGVAVIRHGWGWLRRGPYATILLGIAVLDGFVRMPAAQRAVLGAAAPMVVVFTLVIVPVAWFLMTRYDIAPRKGIALILSPSDMLLRTRAGVHRVAWKNLTRAEIQSRNAWSILQGQHQSRMVVISRKDGDEIQYVEAFLGVPAEVLTTLCDAYRKGILP